MLTPYHGNYEKKDRQKIDNQTWLEKLAEWSVRSPLVYPLPHAILLLGVCPLLIIPTQWAMPYFRVIVLLTILSFSFMFFGLIIDFLQFRVAKTKKDVIYEFIRQHPGCTYSDILNACYRFKLSKLLNPPLEKLQESRQIIAETDGALVFFRIPNEEDYARWEAEEEEWEKYREDNGIT